MIYITEDQAVTSNATLVICMQLNSDGGSVLFLHVEYFPVATEESGALTCFKPGALRQMHWHTTNSEWEFVVNGTLQVLAYAITHICNECYSDICQAMQWHHGSVMLLNTLSGLMIGLFTWPLAFAIIETHVALFESFISPQMPNTVYKTV